jgi:hypothetical protein
MNPREELSRRIRAVEAEIERLTDNGSLIKQIINRNRDIERSAPPSAAKRARRARQGFERIESDRKAAIKSREAQLKLLKRQLKDLR